MGRPLPGDGVGLGERMRQRDRDAMNAEHGVPCGRCGHLVRWITRPHEGGKRLPLAFDPSPTGRYEWVAGREYAVPATDGTPPEHRYHGHRCPNRRPTAPSGAAA